MSATVEAAPGPRAGGTGRVRRVVFGCLALGVFGLAISLQAARTGQVAPAAASAGGADRAGALAAYRDLPLAFVPNVGQDDARVRYSAQAGGASFSFTKKAAVLTLRRGGKAVALHLAFVGANREPVIEGRELGPGPGQLPARERPGEVADEPSHLRGGRLPGLVAGH
jgi:hypothetical protein